MHENHDIAGLRLPANRAASPSRKQRPRVGHGKRFLKGPIPWDWLERAGGLPGKALQVAIVLWFESGMKNSLHVEVPSAPLRNMGVDRYAANRGLKELEGAGLVSAVRAPGRTSRVTILLLHPPIPDTNPFPGAATVVDPTG